MTGTVRPAGERLLIIASSARALAASAGRAGYRPDVIDLFADADTRELAGECRIVAGRTWGLDPDELLSCLARYHVLHGPVAILPGTGFESRPWLLARLADFGHVHGNDPETVRRAKDPSVFTATLQRLGLPVPPMSLLPVVSGEWLCKPVGSCGGLGIRAWMPGDAWSSGYYLQRRLNGRPASVLFLADGERSCVVGYNLCETVSGSDLRFAAAVGYRPAPILAGKLEAAVTVVVREFGLRGLCGLDVLVDGENFHILEINPRPPASFELHEAGLGLVAAHVAACNGDLQPPPASSGYDGKRVVYAREDGMIQAGFVWPEWCADRPPLPAVISAAEPVCTIFATGDSPLTTLARLRQREQLLQVALHGQSLISANDNSMTTKETMYEQPIPRDEYELA